MTEATKKGSRRTPTSREKGNVLFKGRAVPARLFPFSTAAEQLARHIMDDIDAEVLPVGTELPDRNTLSTRYRGSTAMNQRAVADALYILAYRGYVTLGTEYNNLHRYIVTTPYRYVSERNGHAQDLMTKIHREELSDATQLHQPFPLIWEPVSMSTTTVPDLFRDNFSSGRSVDSVKVFYFVDRVWSARDVVAIHQTWVYPYPELAMAVVNRISEHAPATLRDIESLVDIDTVDEQMTVDIAEPEQRGDFLVGSKWVEPFTIATIHRRAYDRQHQMVLGQLSWYRADRFSFSTHYDFAEDGRWLPQP